MIYRLLAKFNDDFLMVFIFPPGALALMLLGLIGFVGVWAVVVVMRSFERLLARKAIGVNRCPCCSKDSVFSLTPSVEWDSVVSCGGCGQLFESGGRRVQPEEDPEADD